MWLLALSSPLQHWRPLVLRGTLPKRVCQPAISPNDNLSKGITMSKCRAVHALFAVALFTVACDQTSPSTGDAPAFVRSATKDLPYGDGPVSPVLDSINQVLASRGLNVQIERAEFVVANKAGAAASGQVIFANDRAKQLTSRWVVGDERRGADGDHINWLAVDPFMGANTSAGPQDVTASIASAFGTWDNQTCSTLDIDEREWGGTTFPSAILDFGIPADPFEANINIIGFLPGTLFDAVLGDGSSESVLGVTFSFVFINPDETPTDINHDGRDDTAFKEMWFNNDFTWTTSGLGSDIDVETVALHEIGHAFEMGHFGKIFGTLGNLKLHVAPRAVMNAVILGTLRSPLGTDNASFCSSWASWPK